MMREEGRGEEHRNPHPLGRVPLLDDGQGLLFEWAVLGVGLAIAIADAALDKSPWPAAESSSSIRLDAHGRSAKDDRPTFSFGKRSLDADVPGGSRQTPCLSGVATDLDLRCVRGHYIERRSVGAGRVPHSAAAYQSVVWVAPQSA